MLLSVGLFAAALTKQDASQYSLDEFAVRMAIYERHIVKSDEVWFVSEDAFFIADLRRRKPGIDIRQKIISVFDKKKKRPVDRQTGEPETILNIVSVSIQGKAANAGFSWYSAPLGAAWISVKLKKQEGRWIIVEWRYDAIS